MNAFNRIVMLVIALLLVGVPVLLLLIAFGVLPAGPLGAMTGALGGLPDALSAPGAGPVVGIAGVLVALVALFLLLWELKPGPRAARQVALQEEPGTNTHVTAKAVKSLTEGAAREAGAASPKASLASRKGSYAVFCDLQIPSGEHFTEVAARAREEIQRVLEDQEVPVREVEVTVKGTGSGDAASQGAGLRKAVSGTAS
ncbi:MAG: hypothetical protein H0V53_06385 [Rubrobacter sp.]|nr:hypothetical protein [Rubrobacter sp.]